ncbi:hypothetical protein Taro_037247 [Colocasia esculenta]|uniref:Uncharacterized protein n=1 Tax=Colocasia esculenta TaxID=4460 RepID=A0A843WIP3_COLES|nr:hypothetical protein [Colocasia esculenta]
MAVRGCLGRRGRSCFGFVLLLLLNVAAVRVAIAGEAPHQLGANCGSIDACRAGVANDACCRAINSAIVQGTCSCACRQLSVYDHPNLAATCSQKSGCPMCRNCKCSGASSDGQQPSISNM